MCPLTTITFFNYKNDQRLWAFTQMGFARSKLKRTRGLNFWKLLGSGQGIGFSIKPDWNKYALICTWETDKDADSFFRNSSLNLSFSTHAEEILTLRMLAVQSHGLWSGKNPFNQTIGISPDRPVAVLTRATIHFLRLKQFWSHVPKASRSLENAPGLIFSAGIGEAPFFRQATFSIWKNLDTMESYAYRTDIHKEIIRKTRMGNWYKEELFARFQIISSEGTLKGKNPMEGLS